MEPTLFLVAALTAAAFAGGDMSAAPTASPATCLLIGDSIAVRLGPFKPECMLVAQNGITSDEVVAMAPSDTGFTRVIVSMGGNDWRTRAPLEKNLARMRQLYPRAQFAWIAPRRGKNADIVADFGARHHDFFLRTADFPSRDNAHPLYPADVAARIP